MPPSYEQQVLVLDRPIATSASDHTRSDYVLSALQGDAELRAALDGLAPGRSQQKTKSADDTGKPVEPPGVFVAFIAVAGFSGIRGPTTLPLKPSPGLTIATSRRGSGKACLAEGLEPLLTGQNYRWPNRTKERCEGWRNLHQPNAVALYAELVGDRKGPLTVKRAWTGPELDEAEASSQAKATSYQATVGTQVGRRIPALSSADLARCPPDDPTNPGRRTASSCTNETRVGRSRPHAAHR